MLLLSPHHFSQYKLLDSGNYKKLEQFGSYILSRPEPQAVWDTHLNENEWNRLLHAEFKRDKANPERGDWQLKAGVVEPWSIGYKTKELDLSFKLGFTSFKHVGLFPEQASNWDYISQKIRLLKAPQPKMLNLFAYTGGASLAARAAGAEVVHVDSVKQVISWSRENMENSGLDGIRWVVEDVMKFVQREVKRGSKYQGIILDPPAYGRGPAGEKWVIEQHLNELLKLCRELLDKEHFFILNLYSLGFSPLIVESMVQSVFGQVPQAEYGDLFVQDQAGRRLPLSIFGRFSTV